MSPDTLRAEPFLQVHLGCGDKHLDGWVNCDYYPGHAVDVAFDLMAPWPFRTGSVSNVYASHVLEHLPDPRHFFHELHRVCSDGAGVLIRVPNGWATEGMADIEHLRPWYHQSFHMLHPLYRPLMGNPQYGSWTAFFNVTLMQLRIGREWRRIVKWKPLRRLLFRCEPHLSNVVKELFVYMAALKSGEAIAAYNERVPIVTSRYQYIMSRQDYDGLPSKPGDPFTPVYLN